MEPVQIHRFRKKHKLVKVWLPLKHIKKITTMLFTMDDTIDKEVKDYLKQQAKEKGK